MTFKEQEIKEHNIAVNKKLLDLHSLKMAELVNKPKCKNCNGTKKIATPFGMSVCGCDLSWPKFTIILHHLKEWLLAIYAEMSLQKILYLLIYCTTWNADTQKNTKEWTNDTFYKSTFRKNLQQGKKCLQEKTS